MEVPQDWKPTSLDEVRERLGEPEALFGPKWAYLWIGIALSTFLCAGGIALLLGVVEDELGIALDCAGYTMGILLPVFALTVLWQMHHYAKFQLLLYPDAIVLRTHGKVCVVPWKSIVEILQLQNSTRTVLLIRKSEARVRFDTDFIDNAKELRSRLTSESLRRGIRNRTAEASGHSPRRVNRLNLPTIQSSVDVFAFGEPVVEILKLAERIARMRFLLEYVGTEHVLLALVESAPNAATNALQRSGLSLSDLKNRAEAINIPSGPTAPTDLEELFATPRTISALIMAEEELAAAEGTVALLLGLFREQEGVAGVVLAQAGVTEAGLRKAAGLRVSN